MDNKLRSLAELIASESASPLSKFGFGNIDQALETSLNLKPIGKFIQVLDESGKIGRKSDNLKNVQLPISLNALKNATKGLITFETNRSIGNTPLRIITFPVIENNHATKIVQIASSLGGSGGCPQYLVYHLDHHCPFGFDGGDLGRAISCP